MSVRINEQEFMAQMRGDFVLAGRTFLCSSPDEPADFWWGQRAVLTAMSKSRYVFCCAARGAGKTYMMAVYAILRAMMFPRHRVGIVSASFRQAKMVFSEIKKIYSYSPVLKASTEKEPIMGSDSCYLPFNNGSIIIALPLGDGETIRGSRFHTLLADEAVKIPQEIIELSIMPMMNVNKDPMLSAKREALKEQLKKLGVDPGDDENIDNLSGNQIIFMSTAWFQFCYMYKVYSQWKEQEKIDKEAGIDSQYAVFEFPYTAIPAGFLDKDYIEMTRKNISPVRFAMENLAFWPPDTDGFFPASIFEACRGNFAPKLRGSKDKCYAIGIDPARENDNFVIGVAEIDPTGKTENRLVYMESMNTSNFKGTNGFKEMNEKIRSVHRAFPTTLRIGLDSGGGGLALRDSLSEPFVYIDADGKQIIEPPIFQIKDQNEIHDKIRDPKALRILDLIDFSSEWINVSSWELRNKVEQRKLTFPSPPRNNNKEFMVEDIKCGGLMVDVRDIICEEIDEAIDECMNIETVELPSKKGYFRFQTANKNKKKDRWASLIIVARVILDLETSMKIVPPEISQSGASIQDIEYSGELSGKYGVAETRQISAIVVGIDNNNNYDVGLNGSVRTNYMAASLTR